MIDDKNNFKIRIASDSDLQKIEIIWQDGLKKIYPSLKIDDTIISAFRENFNKRENYFNFWVAENEGIIGWCSILPAFSHPLKQKTTAEVSTYVDNSIIDKGVGTKLMQHVFETIAPFKLECVFAFVSSSNLKAIKMCEKAGMKISGYTSTKAILLKENL